MTMNPLCDKCSHLEEDHVAGLFGVICKGLHWFESRQTDACSCTGFVAPDPVEAAA